METDFDLFIGLAGGHKKNTLSKSVILFLVLRTALCYQLLFISSTYFTVWKALCVNSIACFEKRMLPCGYSPLATNGKNKKHTNVYYTYNYHNLGWSVCLLITFRAFATFKRPHRNRFYMNISR